MIIIYHCFGGSHSSVTAAALHLGILDCNHIPSAAELLKVPSFDKTTDADFGSIRFMGTDEAGNDIYVMGKKSFNNRYCALLMGVARILDSENKLLMVNCMEGVNWIMKIGGFASRRLGWTLLGRPVVSWGTGRAFARLVKIVDITRRMLRKHTHSPVT